MQLVGDRDPRAHEFGQLRGFDAAKTGAKNRRRIANRAVRRVAAQVGSRRFGSCRRGHPRRNHRTNYNAVSLAEIAVEKGAKSLLLPVSARRQLFDLSDEMATRLDIEFYQDAKDALMKALAD